MARVVCKLRCFGCVLKTSFDVGVVNSFPGNVQGIDIYIYGGLKKKRVPTLAVRILRAGMFGCEQEFWLHVSKGCGDHQ